MSVTWLLTLVVSYTSASEIPRASLNGQLSSDETKARSSDFGGRIRFPVGLEVFANLGGTNEIRYDDLLAKDLDYSTRRWSAGFSSSRQFPFSAGLNFSIDGQKDVFEESRLSLPIEYNHKLFMIALIPEWRQADVSAQFGKSTETRELSGNGVSTSVSLFYRDWSLNWSWTEIGYDDGFDFMNRPLLYNLLKTFRPVEVSFIEAIPARTWSLEAIYDQDKFSVGTSYLISYALFQGTKSETTTVFGTYFINKLWALDIAAGTTGDLYVNRDKKVRFLTLGVTIDFY